LKLTLLPTALLAATLALVACGGGGGSGSDSSVVTPPPSGIAYGANEIVYGFPDSTGSTFSVAEYKPGGTQTVLASGLSTSILLFTQIPGKSNSFVIAADLAGKNVFGIYDSTGLSTANTTTVVPAIYSYVSSMTVSSDGANLVYTATLASDPTQTSYLFTLPLAGGLPKQLDYGDGSTLSPADNDTIAYVASPGGSANFDQVFTRSLSAGVSGKATQVTTDSINHILPAYNRQGTELAYWESSSNNALMLQAVGSTAAPVVLGNLPNQVVPQGESFSADGSQVAIAGDAGGMGEILTQAASAGSSPTVLYTNSGALLGNYGVYWTDGNGKVLMRSMMPTAARRRTGLPFLAAKHAGR
jgi:hypothetical protein